jgi:regulator of replication initiation timing
MWRKLWEFITNALTLARDIEETRTEIKEVREELHRLSLTTVKLEAALRALAQHEQDQREKLLLQLQLEQKQLPPKPTTKKRSRKGRK